MSTTMLSASRSARRNVASTTNVAPCRRCAGPKTSPEKLWATITWSRTVMLNTMSAPSLLAIGDTDAERRRVSRDPRHLPCQVGERDLARHQRVEGGVGEQLQGQRHPVAVGAPHAPGRRDRA